MSDKYTELCVSLRFKADNLFCSRSVVIKVPIGAIIHDIQVFIMGDKIGDMKFYIPNSDTELSNE